VKRPKFLGGTPAADERPAQSSRRRRRPRPDGPRTIIPLADDARPSWLHDDAPAARPGEPSDLAGDLDAARARLRREIPPVDDDLA